VRELVNAVEHAVNFTTGETLAVKHLPAYLRKKQFENPRPGEDKIMTIIRMTHSPRIMVIGNDDSGRFFEEARAKDKIEYVLQLGQVRAQTIELIIEVLRYQKWK
jgi:hypothetical protein